MCAVLVFAAVAAPASWCARLLSLPPTVWLGEISFGIYLAHRIVQWGLRETFGALPPMLGAVRAGALTLLVATAAYRFYEDPMRRLVRRAAARLLAREPASAA